MIIKFIYACECGCTWTTHQSLVGMSFIDSSCVCPTCDEENQAVSQEVA